MKHTKVRWGRGITLMTPTTKRWSKEQIEKNDNIEQTMIFSDFSGLFDSGKGRKLVCTLNPAHIDYEKNAKLISAAPDLLYIVERFKKYYDAKMLKNLDAKLADDINKAIKKATE